MRNECDQLQAAEQDHRPAQSPPCAEGINQHAYWGGSVPYLPATGCGKHQPHLLLRLTCRLVASKDGVSSMCCSSRPGVQTRMFIPAACRHVLQC